MPICPSRVYPPISNQNKVHELIDPSISPPNRMEIISPTVGTLQRLICRRVHAFGIEMVNQNLVVKGLFGFPIMRVQ